MGDPEGCRDPAGTERTSSTWADFLRSQADALLACDFFETITLSGTRLYVFAVIGHAGRRIRVLGATAHPTASWVAQAARNLVMDLQDAGCQARYVIRDRDGKFPELFDTILADAGIEVALSGIRIPRMNSIMERWVQTCRRELLDRTLIWNQRHLLHALREFEQFYNAHRPHQGIANACPLHPLPEPITDHRSPITDPDEIARLDIHRTDRLGGLLHEYQHAAQPGRMRFPARAALTHGYAVPDGDLLGPTRTSLTRSRRTRWRSGTSAVPAFSRSWARKPSRSSASLR
ncbi:hypothetical protein GCM10027073_25320 [Streptomyces chlorus]